MTLAIPHIKKVWSAVLLLSILPLYVSAADISHGFESIRLEYQYIRTGEFKAKDFDVDIGNTDSQALITSVTYAVNNRWKLNATLPWIRKRHTGPTPHNALLDFQNYKPSSFDVVDDGKYHGNFQDLYVSVQYLLKDGPLAVAPYISGGVPTNDYIFYGHAAIGRNIWHVPVGVSIEFQPSFSDYYVNTDIAYVFTEKTMGIDISHWLISAEIGWYVTPRFAPKLFFVSKRASDGLVATDFDPTKIDNEKWYKHDRTIKHNYINGGVGFDWSVTDKYQISASWFTMLTPEEVNDVERAWTIAVTRYF